MKLFLVRHGIAEDAGPGRPDQARRLTPEGRLRVRQVAAALDRLGVKPEVILTSPLPRAAETAVILGERLMPGAPPQEVAALATGSSAPEALRALGPFARCRRLMLVGHEPTLSELVSLVLAGAVHTVAVHFRKGGCVALDLAQPHPPCGATLAWMLTPRQLRRLAR